MLPTNKKVRLNQLYSFLVETAVRLIILFISWLIIVNLPMLQEMQLPLQFSLADLLSAAVLILIVAALLSLALRLKYHLGFLAPVYQKSSVLVKQFLITVSVLLIYLAFKPLLVPYLDNPAWAFHLVFLLAFLALLALLGYSLYKHTRQLIILFTNPVVKEMLTTTLVTCAYCGDKNMAGSSYCSSCGKKLPQLLQCSSCGTDLQEESKFCPECGAARSLAPV